MDRLDHSPRLTVVVRSVVSEWVLVSVELWRDRLASADGGRPVRGAGVGVGLHHGASQTGSGPGSGA